MKRANEKNISGSQFLGMHLEGPYFAMIKEALKTPVTSEILTLTNTWNILGRSAALKDGVLHRN
jgi:N-acetylglucosamine-6-phosphate deacetylase